MAPGQPPDHASTPDSLFGPKDARERPEPLPGLTEGRALGDFRLVRLIGGGGMGDVWEAKQLSLGGRKVALKFIRPDKVGDRALELFAREARAGGRLNHPGIVGVYGFGETDGYAWIAMEFVEGAWTLRDFLADMAREAELPPDYDLKVAEFVALAADALHVAHQGGVIHRDLKPQNILIGPDHRPRIADFGLARITDETEMSRTGEFAGTYHYMSPEQVTARRMGIDLRTDVFSLGVVLYEMLTLRRPFNGDTTHQVAAQIVTKDPPDPRTFRSKVPRDLAVIVGKALEKDPDRRFQTMAEFAADLRRVLAHEPILAQPPTTTDKIVKWVRRNPTRSAVSALGAVALAIVALMQLRLTNANDFLERSISELEEANAELAKRDREAKVFGLTSELAYFETLDDDAYTYARKVERPTSEWWIEGASLLVHGQTEDRLSNRAWLPGLKDVEDALAKLRKKARDRTPEQVEADHLAHAALGITSDQRRTWRFPDGRDESLHGELVKIVENLRWLSRKLEVSERSIRDIEYAREWNNVIVDLQTNARYRDTQWPCGDRLTPQLGLVPIGRDPDSGLWEFAHLLSGERAQRDSSGKLALDADTGLVFVLLPGGRVPVAQGESAYDQDESITRVQLDPFFISKFEMTGRQWETLAGIPGTNNWSGLEPVESETWITCFERLAQCGWLQLPTLAQWEYGCRATTTTRWWPSDDENDLVGVANFRTRSEGSTTLLQGHSSDFERPNATVGLLEVGRLRPNLFGLYDVHGNAEEWCRDTWTTSDVARRLGDGLYNESDSLARVSRGGSYKDEAYSLCSSPGGGGIPITFMDRHGLRPSRPITP